MAMLPANVVEAVEAVLKNKDGVMKKWGQIEEILLEAKLAYKQVFPPYLFMVHPLNRGGTGVNPFSCHRKGGAIVAAGADLHQLGGAVAFELATDEALRHKQLEFNIAQAASSQGVMPPPSGKERFLTTSKSHTVMFCKALAQGCKTCVEHLKGPGGCLGSHLMNHDKQLQQMIDIGWEWTIVQSKVAEKWPGLPTLAESAGNSSNSVYEMQNEVQLMSAISLAYQHHGGKADWPKLAEELCLSGPLQGYATAVGRFVQMYGGPRMLHVCFHIICQAHWALEIKCEESSPWVSCMLPFKPQRLIYLSSQDTSCLSSPTGSMTARNQLIVLT